jgi:hypothetical protein
MDLQELPINRTPKSRCTSTLSFASLGVAWLPHGCPVCARCVTGVSPMRVGPQGRHTGNTLCAHRGATGPTPAPLASRAGQTWRSGPSRRGGVEARCAKLACKSLGGELPPEARCRFRRLGRSRSQAGDEAFPCLETFWRNDDWHQLVLHTLLNPARNRDAPALFGASLAGLTKTRGAGTVEAPEASASTLG